MRRRAGGSAHTSRGSCPGVGVRAWVRRRLASVVRRNGVSKIRMTPARWEALGLVDDGKIHQHRPLRGDWRWKLEGQWQGLRPAPYLALLEAGLIALGPPTRHGFIREVALTDAGRATLAARTQP